MAARSTMKQKVKVERDLVWANEVMEVFQNFGKQSIDCNWSTQSAKYLYTWTREDAKNEEKFLTTMVPKASDTIAKHGAVDIDEKAVQIDRKTIADLQECLRGALGKSVTADQKPAEPTNAEMLAELLR